MSAAKYPLPYPFARSHLLLLEQDGAQLSLSWAPPGHAASPPPEAVPAAARAAAAADPQAPASAVARLSALSEVIRHWRPQRIVLQPEAELAQRISAAYAAQSGAGSAADVVSELQSDVDLTRMMQELPAVEDLLESADDAPIIRMLNALLSQAARDGASDIHIEPYERHFAVRFRIDGTLRDIVQPSRALHAALISRLKIMAELDISEKRLPQDGRISLRLGTRAIDVRVSTLPNAHGERAVLRLLDKSDSKLSLEAVGMQGDTLARFEKLIAQPHGILLVTGPTGSGKTTTLYAALQQLDARTTNILTVEDPIEYELPGIGQTQVNPKIDLSFAKALRAILRQDPDAIMIGEIRDFETAQIAVQASLTGHLVLATLHTNDAPSAITRLADMGIEPFLLSSSLLGVLAQRLVRKLCPHCKAPAPPLDIGTTFGLAAEHIPPELPRPLPHWSSPGCPHCAMSGYSGRTGIFELLSVDDSLRALIHRRAPEAELAHAAASAGMVRMRADGLRLVAQGTTSAEELLRVTRD